MKTLFTKILNTFFSTLVIIRKQLGIPDKESRVKIRLCRTILHFYRKNPKLADDKEIKDVLSYIKEKGFSVFPYYFTEKYKSEDVTIELDKNSDLRYTIHNNYRLYFRRSTGISGLKNQYAFLLSEQDPNSPHCYLSNDFDFPEGAILFDIGAAEGNFSLSMIDKASKIYIFEYEEDWLEPLKKTFEPWKNKVEIIQKYVSSENSEKTVTLDSLAQELPVGSKLFIKMDVEGAELSVINGAKNIFDSGKYDTKAVICTYHEQEDYDVLSRTMKQKGFEVEHSKGYMLFIENKIVPPYFRRGLIRCSKDKN